MPLLPLKIIVYPDQRHPLQRQLLLNYRNEIDFNRHRLPMNDIPITVKRSIELLGLLAVGFILSAGKYIIVPLLLALFISILLLPLFRFFRKIGIPEIAAILLPIVCLTIFAGGIGWLFYDQLSSFLQDLPAISRNVNRLLDHLSIWIRKVFGYSPDEQLTILHQNNDRLLAYVESALKQTVTSLSRWFVLFGILPAYIFFILFYRKIFIKFITMSVRKRGQEEAGRIIPLLERVVLRYLVGLLIQFSYIIILLGGTLTLAGIKHGFLIGILFAFLNLIPYLGPLIGNILGIVIVLASSENLLDVLIVFGAIAVVQFLDNNILMPRIVGAQVKINALVSIAGIFTGGALAGISGMFLAMPVIAVIKIIFDHSAGFRNWGVLLGDDRSPNT
jgi:predicted PurR-regulated permease PerM